MDYGMLAGGHWSADLENGFQIWSRQSDMENAAGSWTCRTYFDDATVQLEFLIADMRTRTSAVWMDFFSLPIGLDHRRVDCLLVWEMANMKNSQQEHA